MELGVGSRLRGLVVTTAIMSGMFGSVAAQPAADQERAVAFQIAPQDLDAALLAYGRATNRQILFSPKDVAGRRAPALTGAHEPSAALDLLLTGSGLSWRRAASGAVLIKGADVGPQAAAAAADALPDAELLNEVVVTGTRIRGAAPVGSKATVLDRDGIALTGRSTAGDIVRSLPGNVPLGASEEAQGSVQAGPTNLGAATGPNLRGLGVDATLSLVNGHRLAETFYGGFADVSQIPVIALERVEVVADGASAIYGTDAVGGVVNFILRSDFDGAETRARAGFGDGIEEYGLSQAIGRTWTGGGAFLALEYYQRSNLAAVDRSYYTNDLRAFGGVDLRSQNASPGTISANGTTYAIPGGQNGRGLTAAQLVAGTRNQDNIWEGADILPQVERWSAAATFSHRLTPNLRVFFDGVGARKDSLRRLQAPVATLTVPRSNPFFVSPVPGAASVSVLYSYIGDFGAFEQLSRTRDTTLHGGAELELGAGWRAELSGTAGRNSVAYVRDWTANSVLVNQALADPNPATAFNPFGDAGSNSREVLERVRGFSGTYSRQHFESVGLEASGPVLDLPAGALQVALGAETRRDRFRRWDYRFTASALPSFPAGVFHRSLTAAFAEAVIPLVGPSNARPGIRTLRASAAVRAERYSDFGETVNPKLGLQWSPVEDLELRGTWGSSFKAPTLSQKDVTQNSILTQTITNASLPGGRVNVIQLSGNGPGLGPEEAETFTVGATYAPTSLPGLRLSLDYFDVSYRNRILRSTPTEIVAALVSTSPNPIVIARTPSAAAVAGYYADPLFSTGSVRYPADQIFAVIDFRQVNLGRVDQAGFDLGARYGFETAIGRIDLDGELTYITRYAVARSPSGPSNDLRNTTSSPIDLRGQLRATWSRDGWRAAVTAQVVNGYDNTTVGPAQPVPAWTTFDGHLAYTVGKGGGRLAGLNVALDVRNLFDLDPPRVANTFGPFGYDSEYATALGRFMSVTLTKAW